MFNIEDTKIQNIDHLGIVAGIVDSIGLVEIINKFVPQEQGEKVSAGHVVKAMILNGLGFVSKPLYMFPQYFETIPSLAKLGGTEADTAHFALRTPLRRRNKTRTSE